MTEFYIIITYFGIDIKVLNNNNKGRVMVQKSMQNLLHKWIFVFQAVTGKMLLME